MTTHTEIAQALIDALPAVQAGVIEIRVSWDEYYQAWRVYTRTPIHGADGQLTGHTGWGQAGWAADGTPEEILHGVCEAVHPGAISVARWQGEDGILYESTTIDGDGAGEDIHIGFYRPAEEPEALIVAAATDMGGWQGRLDWYAPGQDGVTIEGVEDPDRCKSMTDLICELAADAEE